jgi:omega-3 fatty acid desaturase (delta-15 desaturase)
MERDIALTTLTREKIKSCIPPHCFVRSVYRSLGYFLRDILIIFFLCFMAWSLDSWLFYPVFWFALGTMLWALFIIGHDCGHGSFSDYFWLNYLLGNISHSVLLVPFHAWKVSHRKHHTHTNSFENEEVFALPNYTDYKKMTWLSRMLRYRLFLLAFPLYLLGITWNGLHHTIKQSHFFPSSYLFAPQDKKWVMVGTLSCLLCLVFYVFLGVHFGLKFAMNFLIMPYLFFVGWLAFVTYLHHSSPSLPIYREKM